MVPYGGVVTNAQTSPATKIESRGRQGTGKQGGRGRGLGDVGRCWGGGWPLQQSVGEPAESSLVFSWNTLLEAGSRPRPSPDSAVPGRGYKRHFHFPLRALAPPQPDAGACPPDTLGVSVDASVSVAAAACDELELWLASCFLACSRGLVTARHLQSRHISQ